MQLPFFYEENFQQQDPIILSENSSRHIVQVLRMQEGDKIKITDGKGSIYTAEITVPHKKNAEIKILETTLIPQTLPNICVAISFIKNAGRFEWFLEKATEIGVTQMIPLLCKRTEKTHFREDRMKTILVSAMLQSQQAWLPVIASPIKLEELVKSVEFTTKFIAHCLDGKKQELKECINSESSSKIILIGPEGDFTQEEIDSALVQNFIPVSLGETRLRTETAGLVAAVLLK
ncbi:MAG: RsmE family RNA methyltransferase [Ginsengibacter sp.]